MRALRVLIPIAALIALAGVAAAQAPCPSCDPPENGTWTNPFHGVDVGVIDRNETGETQTEVLEETDVAHASPDDEKGFWAWISICCSAFFQSIENMLGIQTDVDAHVSVYAESDGFDADANVTGLQPVCDELEVETSCAVDVEDTQLSEIDDMSWQTIARAESATEQDVFVPAVVPDTGWTETAVCIDVDHVLCG